MGIYTIVYGGTLYVCLTKTTPNTSNRVVLPTITILYLFALVYFILVWYILNWTYVLHGDTKASIFVASYAPPGWFNIADELLQGLPIVIADALLIWRCYHVWGKSWKAISFPSFFLVSELILGISDVILESQVPLYSMAGSSTLARKIKTALAFTSVITTSSSTFLIGYKIRTVSNGIGQSSTRYIRIFTIILESSAIYSVVLLMFALTFLPVFDSDNLESPLSQAGIYVASLLNIISVCEMRISDLLDAEDPYLGTATDHYGPVDCAIHFKQQDFDGYKNQRVYNEL
ncbi:hypothetical protein JR316_0009427 [Psilocybe cubensis]|uniref:Uncharacterized protein n=2 Tax=Psilocybe cubensis TaxID=181762 RepID=A0ACB8GU19_PSICU|nr:hypothetical protein JR316_0009427 [Psilocybe cubensis]KAH9478964.1 hypothetical protein JR316_0009427 [Psilocybe cubensis]